MMDTIGKDDGFLEEGLFNDIWLWVSTVTPDYRPALYLHWFLWSEEKIYLFLREGTYDLENLQQVPFVSCSLEVANLGEQVAILEGSVEALSTKDIPELFTTYLEKYENIIHALRWNVEELWKEFSYAVRITPIRRLPWPPTPAPAPQPEK